MKSISMISRICNHSNKYIWKCVMLIDKIYASFIRFINDCKGIKILLIYILKNTCSVVVRIYNSQAKDTIPKLNQLLKRCSKI